MSELENHKLLIDESPLTVLPSLVSLLGLEKAIILQQIHYSIRQKKSGKILADGFKYIWNTYDEWQEIFTFWSAKTIKYHILQLEKDGYLISQQPEKSGWDRTKYYRINYSKIESNLDHRRANQLDHREANRLDHRRANQLDHQSANELDHLNKEQRILTKTSSKNSTHTERARAASPVKISQRTNATSVSEIASDNSDDYDRAAWRILEEKRMDSPFDAPNWSRAIAYVKKINPNPLFFARCIEWIGEWAKGRITAEMVANNFGKFLQDTATKEIAASVGCEICRSDPWRTRLTLKDGWVHHNESHTVRRCRCNPPPQIAPSVTTQIQQGAYGTTH